MSDTDNGSSGGCGCGGCLSFAATFVFLWGLFCYIQTPWGWFTWDVFPPALHKSDGDVESFLPPEDTENP